MASSTPGTAIRTGSTGRGFASMDPERQREVPSGIALRSAEDWSPMRPTRPAPSGWVRVQPDRDAAMFEGSSSRRSR
jgi:hypothetical protein